MFHFKFFIIWCFISVLSLILIQEGSRNLAFTRMSFPFLIGTFFTSIRRQAETYGLILYLIGGLLFGIIYGLIMKSMDAQHWWVGSLIGLGQGIFQLLVTIPALPYFHPRMATIFDGPESTLRIEPPGMLGLNYGGLTPIVHLLGQTFFGSILGIAYFL